MVTEKLKFQSRGKSKFLATFFILKPLSVTLKKQCFFLEISDYQDTDAKQILKDFSNTDCHTRLEPSDKSLMENFNFEFTEK